MPKIWKKISSTLDLSYNIMLNCKNIVSFTSKCKWLQNNNHYAPCCKTKLGIMVWNNQHIWIFFPISSNKEETNSNKPIEKTSRTHPNNWMKRTNDLSIDIIMIFFLIQDLFLKVGFTRNEKDVWFFDVHKFIFLCHDFLCYIS